MFAQCLKYMIINDLVSSCHLIERADLFVSRCPIKLLFSDSDLVITSYYLVISLSGQTHLFLAA